MHTPEWHEKQKIKKYLNERGCWFFCPFMAGRGGSGVPDIIACLHGRFVGIEVKGPKGKLTQRQIRQWNDIANAQGMFVWGTADKVIQALDAIQ